jgi:TPR repeat protein
MKALLSIVLLLTFGACVCWSNTPEEIDAAFTPEKVKEYVEAAKKGEAWAENRLGFAHSRGIGGFNKNSVEAVKWWRKAAEQGHADGQTAIGWAYANGNGNGGKDRFLKSFISKNSVKSVNSRAWFYHC